MLFRSQSVDQEKYAQIDGELRVREGNALSAWVNAVRFGARFTDHNRTAEHPLETRPGPNGFSNPGPAWNGSMYPSDFGKDLGGNVFNGYFKFSVVRNPWERLLSDYNYQVRKGRPDASRLLLIDPEGRRRDFAAWTALALGTADACEPNSWGGEVSAGIGRFSPQVDWISLNGRIAVDFVAQIGRAHV